MKTETHEIPSLLADSHELKSVENEEKVVGIVTGVDGIGGLIRRSRHPDPPIATILTPPTSPPAEREPPPRGFYRLGQVSLK